MTVQVPGEDAPRLEALVVTLGDGRLGFSGPLGQVAALDAGAVELTREQTISGLAIVVRSGTSYEEVRGRTRRAEGWLARWRRRHDDAVVLVRPGDLS